MKRIFLAIIAFSAVSAQAKNVFFCEQPGLAKTKTRAMVAKSDDDGFTVTVGRGPRTLGTFKKCDTDEYNPILSCSDTISGYTSFILNYARQGDDSRKYSGSLTKEDGTTLNLPCEEQQ